MAIRGMHKTINGPATDLATTGMGCKTTNGTAHSPIDLIHLKHLRDPVRLKEVQGVRVEDAQGQELVHQEILGPSIIESMYSSFRYLGHV
jgi:hypothetical protein